MMGKDTGDETGYQRWNRSLAMGQGTREWDMIFDVREYQRWDRILDMGEDANDGKGYWRWNRLLEIRQILEMGQDSAYATGCYT